MILRQPAKITKDQPALDAYEGLSYYFTPAIPTVSFLGGWVVMMMSGTVVFFERDVISTETIPAPVAGKRDFIEYFPAIVAPEHYSES